MRPHQGCTKAGTDPMAMEKTFDASEAEARLYKAWEDSGAFQAGANASRSGAAAQIRRAISA